MRDGNHRRATRWQPRAARLLGLWCLAASTIACGSKPGVSGFLNQAPDVRYVGIDNCVDCHQDKAATYAKTGMGRSFYPMTAEVAIEDFSERNDIEIPWQGLRYRMTRRDGKFFMRQSASDGRGGEMAVDERDLVFVVGSGNHSRSYLTVENGSLFQAPVCWYPEKGTWDLCPGYEENNDHFTREITESCVFCHNGRMELLPGERSRYVEPIPFGIDCERCHGPGQLHVDRWRSGRDTPDGSADPTIVNPERLPSDLRIQVCFQCHFGDSKASERVPRRDHLLGDFRPGRPVTDVMVPFFFREGRRSEFGLSSQGDRLLRSRCYQASGGKIECLTCHDPHVTVYRKERPLEIYREKCLGCHQTADCTGPAERRRQTAPLGDDCLQCHMRKVPPDDHPHTRFTDHWIRRSSEYGGPPEPPSADLVPVFPDALAALATPEQTYYRGRAHFLKSLHAPAAVRATLWRTGAEAFQSAIRNGLESADAPFFLGKILQYERRWDEAIAAFGDAVARDPGHHDAALALGSALVQQGKIAEAALVFRRALERWPGDPGAMAELARCEAASGRTHEALALYNRAVAAMTWNAGFRMNQGVLYSALGRHPEALRACREAMRLDPGDVGIWKTCAEVLLSAGLPSEAGGAARRAELLAARRGFGDGNRD